MTKDFVVRRKETKDAAIDALKLEVATYLTGLDGNPNWKWLVEPEALFGNGGWRSYGRIEWSKTT
jgi:hypothetical protein